MGSSGKYDNEFDQQRLIGGGGFGKAYEVVKKDDKSKSVIKKIFCTDNRECDEMIKDLEIGSKIRSDAVVPIGKYWSEKVICRQMECCSGNLSHIIAVLANSFSPDSGDYERAVINYFMSGEIFEEMTRCVRHLHSQNPPIIAKNLRPKNFLITDGNNESKQFLKLSDFGYYRERMILFDKYLCPEMDVNYPHYSQSNVTTKADIYRLGVIAQEVYGINVFTPMDSYDRMFAKKNEKLKQRYRELEKVFVDMTNFQMRNRPDCEQVLAQINERRLDSNAINEIKVSLNKVNFDSTHPWKEFVLNFLRTKINSRTPSVADVSDLDRKRDLKAQLDQLRPPIPDIRGKYKKDFDEKLVIGEGIYGKVYEVMSNTDRKLYAIKEIVFKDNEWDDEINELRNLLKKPNEYVVQYFDVWKENKTLYIQMELCIRQSLHKLIKNKPTIFAPPLPHQRPDMTLTDYFISCEIFEEITRSLNYLHSLKPPVIHRDLKPQNILINSTGIVSEQVFKLSDFGYMKRPEGYRAVSGMDAKQLRRSGNIGDGYAENRFQFMAPELLKDQNYDIKADIYSLGVIGQELFGISFSDSHEIYQQELDNKTIGVTILKQYFNHMRGLFQKMTDTNSQVRPNCDTILKQIGAHWLLKKTEIRKIKSIQNLFGDTVADEATNYFRPFLSQYLANKVTKRLERKRRE